MNKDEILAKSRAENKNQDVYEQEILRQACKTAVFIQLILAAVFFIAQILAGKGINWGLWALIFSSDMTIHWVKFRKLRRKYDLATAIAYTALVSVMSVSYICGLIASSAAL